MFGLLAALAHTLATAVRMRRERFRLKRYVASMVSIQWALALGGFAYVLYRNFSVGAYYGNSTPMKLLKGFFTSGGAGGSYLVVMMAVSAHLAKESMDKVVEATTAELATSVATATATAPS